MKSLPIQTRDNSERHLSDEELCHLDTLKKLAEPTISDLCLKERPNLLIFPQDLNVYGDKIGDAHIFEVKSNKIATGNIMGFIGCGNTKISITSRFTQDKYDYFLHYMLRKVFSVNLFDLQFNSDEENIFDFLIYLFPAFLKQALQQGIYREYQTRKYNDANVKGRIDIPRHIRQNIPFAGCIAYTTREYAQDNHLTQLIRHTIEYLLCLRYSGNILHNDDDTLDAVKAICQATKSYNLSERHKVIIQNLRPISHPYYGEYRPLQQLCLQILRQEEMKYGRDDDEIYGVLFDGAWLWEEYLNIVLSELKFEHSRNKERIGKIFMFEDDRSKYLYPDFINKKIVIDAKYKMYNRWDKIQMADLYQLISYMHVLNLDKGCFVTPVDLSPNLNTSKKLCGMGGSISILSLDVGWKTHKYGDFEKSMLYSEHKLRSDIIKLMK